MDEINTSLQGVDRKVALCSLLDKETQLVAAIGRHKINAQDGNEKTRIMAYLEKVG